MSRRQLIRAMDGVIASKVRGRRVSSETAGIEGIGIIGWAFRHSVIRWSVRDGIKRNIKEIPPGTSSIISFLVRAASLNNLLLLLRLRARSSNSLFTQTLSVVVSYLDTHRPNRTL